MPMVQEQALIALGRWLQQQDYRFTTVSPATHARVLARPGRGGELADLFGWNRPFDPERLSARLRELLCDSGLAEAGEGGSWRSRFRFSTLPCRGGELLCAHSAFPTAHAAAVFFGPDTYRYCRALAHWLVQQSDGLRRAIDIGTGSGAGALVIARHAPAATVFATDINEQALQLTRVNAALAGQDNLQPGYSDLLQQVQGQFDLISANPPYLLDADQRLYRHGGGRYGEALSIEMVRAALPRLAPGGSLLLYSGIAIVDGFDTLQRAAQQLVAAVGWPMWYEEIDPDVFGEELENSAYGDADRIAAVLLRVTRPL